MKKVLKKILVGVGVVIGVLFVLCIVIALTVDTDDAPVEKEVVTAVETTEEPEEEVEETVTEPEETEVVEETTSEVETPVIRDISNEKPQELRYGYFYYDNYAAVVSRDEEIAADLVYMYKNENGEYNHFFTGYIFYQDEDGQYEAYDADQYNDMMLTFYDGWMNLYVAYTDEGLLTGIDGNYEEGDEDPAIEIPLRYTTIDTFEGFKYLSRSDDNIGQAVEFTATVTSYEKENGVVVMTIFGDLNNYVFIRVTDYEGSLNFYANDEVRVQAIYSGYDGKSLIFSAKSIELL